MIHTLMRKAHSLTLSKSASVSSLAACLMLSLALNATSELKHPRKELPLTSPILKFIDGMPKIMDKDKVKKLLWAIQEMKLIHDGSIRVKMVDNKEVPEPSIKSTLKKLTFGGKPQTLRTIVNIDARKDQLTPAEQEELKALFTQAKEYFGKVNGKLLADAAGTHQFMMELIEEFCTKNNRKDSALLNWDEGTEGAMYDKNVTSFKVFYWFLKDLMNFLSDLIKSCPKAYDDYLKNRKKKIAVESNQSTKEHDHHLED